MSITAATAYYVVFIFFFSLLTLTDSICHINEEILRVVLNHGWIECSSTEWGLRPGRLQLCGGVEHCGEWEEDKLTGRKSPSLMGLTQQQTGTRALD